MGIHLQTCVAAFKSDMSVQTSSYKGPLFLCLLIVSNV